MKKRRTILRAAVIAALFLVVGMSVWHFCGEDIIAFETSEQAMPTPSATPTASRPVNPPSEATGETSTTPKMAEASINAPLPAPAQHPSQLCTLTILGKQIKVMNNVDEATLNKAPGWLPSSVLPGDNGMCVIYGHRNRRHLQVLENIKIGDEITVTITDGTTFTYIVSETVIFENTSDMSLPMADGKTLVLVTCYPFMYSGNAPGKYMVKTILKP